MGSPGQICNAVGTPCPTAHAPAPLSPRPDPIRSSTRGPDTRINEFPKRGGPGEGRIPAQEKALNWASRGQSGPGRPTARPYAQPRLLAHSSAAHPRPLCPMFRSRRAALLRRLWRQRCPTPGPEEGPGALKPAAHALFKKLKDEELELLLQAVESRGAWESGCVWVPRGPSQALPPRCCCAACSAADLRQPHELKHLCTARARGRGADGDAAVLCCNPHHFSRLAAPETPPPPYSKSISPSWPAEPKSPQLLEFSCNHAEWRGKGRKRGTQKNQCRTGS
ncbi:mothers against decapentaplegic homolog 6-like [Meleagris gallopavo]|uniref:mothers against decapentaplegic homolog 6-like n=1 Tax=Meleagris gallopavo TaxID=9103 RepID=UPI000549A621|nr:mothers against decapentaplegic homolog 6-like [Meleagris gallopavo]